MKPFVKVVLGIFSFAVLFTFLYLDYERRQLTQLLELPVDAAVEIINGGQNHGRQRSLTESDRTAILAELKKIEYAPFHSNRPVFDFSQEYHYITVIDGEQTYHFTIFASKDYGVSHQYCFTYSEELLALLRSLPFSS